MQAPEYFWPNLRFESLEERAAAYSSELRDVFQDKRVHLFGNSFGASLGAIIASLREQAGLASTFVAAEPDPCRNSFERGCSHLRYGDHITSINAVVRTVLPEFGDFLRDKFYDDPAKLKDDLLQILDEDMAEFYLGVCNVVITCRENYMVSSRKEGFLKFTLNCPSAIFIMKNGFKGYYDKAKAHGYEPRNEDGIYGWSEILKGTAVYETRESCEHSKMFYINENCCFASEIIQSVMSLC
jgi:hypothetical protein